MPSEDFSFRFLALCLLACIPVVIISYALIDWVKQKLTRKDPQTEQHPDDVRE